MKCYFLPQNTGFLKRNKVLEQDKIFDVFISFSTVCACIFVARVCVAFSVVRSMTYATLWAAFSTLTFMLVCVYYVFNACQAAEVPTHSTHVFFPTREPT